MKDLKLKYPFNRCPQCFWFFFLPRKLIYAMCYFLTPRLPFAQLFSLICGEVVGRYLVSFRNFMLFAYIWICSLLYNRLPRGLICVSFMLRVIGLYRLCPFYELLSPYSTIWKLWWTKAFAARKNAIATRHNTNEYIALTKFALMQEASRNQRKEEIFSADFISENLI